MNEFLKFIILFEFMLIFIDNFVNLDAGKPKRTNSSILQEYREVLPKDVFTHFSSIYRDKSLKTIEKLKLLDEMFMVLPDSMLKKLPIPSAFRQLPLEERRRIHRIYYGKTIPFREKLRRLEQFLRELPGNERELVPIRPIQEKQQMLGSAERRGEIPMPTLIEFDVPVLLQFNGHMETNALKQYLPKDEFQMLKWILNRHGMDELSRARLIGVLLKKSYQINSDNFPLPLNGDSQEIADEIRRLGVRLMFGRNPFDRVDPFAQKFEMLKRIRANTEKEGGNQRKTCKNGETGDESCLDAEDQLADGPKEKPKNMLQLETIDLFPGIENVASSNEWRQQDEGGRKNDGNLPDEIEEENGRISGNLLGKFISLFNGTAQFIGIHFNFFYLYF